MSIPRRFLRTVPDRSREDVEQWWRRFGELHHGWEFVTYRDPLDPRQFPLTADAWPRCTNGAQIAGLVRLEALWHHGGIYVDSDMVPYRSFGPLLVCEAFAAWEDAKVVPDAVIGARAGHPAIRECITLALERLELGAWESGPGVTTEVFPGRDDVLLLPPGSLYPVHYLEKRRLTDREVNGSRDPWCLASHQWHGSWLSEKQRSGISSRQR